ncbi:hypothetical protein [Formosa sp. 4Alg 33]|uniref:hypothetical protein n=1 Tax=Formosa sp. 4Alg 33 TaxID=3382189 RepID=UPI003D9C53D2
MKTVLIPTDFSEKSLQLIKNAVLHYPNDPIQLVLASGYNKRLNSSNPFGYSKSKLIKRLASGIFQDTLSNLILDHKNKIYSVNIELYTGTSDRDFNDFLRLNHIDESIIPSSELCQFQNRNCVDITPLIDRLAPAVSRVAYKAQKQNPPTRFWFFSLKPFSIK